MKFMTFARRVLVLVVCLFAMGATTACGKSYSWNQKLTVEVQTPDGIKNASSVIGVTYEPALLKPPAAGFDRPTIKITGEAVVLEIQPKRYLFVLLKDLPYAWDIFYPDLPPDEAVKELEKVRKTRELKPDQYPIIVVFDDITDPLSVKKVDRSSVKSIVGDQYAINSISLTITSQPVKFGKLDSILKWLDDYQNKQLDGNRYTDATAPNRFPNSLNRLDFKSGY